MSLSNLCAYYSVTTFTKGKQFIMEECNNISVLVTNTNDHSTMNKNMHATKCIHVYNYSYRCESQGGLSGLRSA
jgi:hypothetical protein